MIVRPSDEQLRDICDDQISAFCVGVNTIQDLARELLAFRSTGRAMPETPSDVVIDAVVGDSDMPGARLMAIGFYQAIYNALGAKVVK